MQFSKRAAYRNLMGCTRVRNIKRQREKDFFFLWLVKGRREGSVEMEAFRITQRGNVSLVENCPQGLLHSLLSQVCLKTWG
jgi:hypothetical protein